MRPFSPPDGGRGFAVHFEAKRLGLSGLSGLSKENIPDAMKVIKEQGHLVIPLVVLIALMFMGYTPLYAAVIAIAATIAASWLRKDTRMTWDKIVTACVERARGAVSVGVCCVIIGVIIGTVTLTSLGLNMGYLILSVVENTNIYLTGLLVMVMSTILGMGVPGVAAYVIVQAVAVPVLLEVDVLPISAHMFCLIYACLSNITPPVAMSSYMAAGIAGSNQTKTGLLSVHLGLVGFLIPFFFLDNPILLIGADPTATVVESLWAMFTASVGTVALAAALMVSVLAGCGGGGNNGANKSSGDASSAGGSSSNVSEPGSDTTPHDPVTINFPTAGSGGALYAVGAAITNLWDTEIAYVSASSQASNGGIDNLNQVSEGESQVSIAISSNCYQCLNGTDSFEGYAYNDLKVIAGLYFNPNQVVVTEKSGITDLASVKGKHFAVAAAGSSVEGECQNHFTAAGLTYPDDINCEYIAFTDAADMLQNGTIDGAWIMSGAPASAVTQACTSGCKLLNISDDVISALQAQYPWYAPFTIPAGTYPNQDEDVQTSAIKMVMFCRGDLDEETVYALTKTFWENIDKLGEAQANLKGLTPEEAVKDIADLPLHPGAEKYYKEIGVL